MTKLTHLKIKVLYCHLWFHEEPLTSIDLFHWTKGSLDFFKGIVHPKKEYPVINYSPSCHSKPVRPSFIFRTQTKIFMMEISAPAWTMKPPYYLVHKDNWNNEFIQQFLLLPVSLQHWEELFYKVVIFVFLANKKYSCSFTKLRFWCHRCHMGYFINILTTFLGLKCVSCVAVYTGSESLDFIKNILTCVLKTNIGLMGLEQHEGELQFLGELSL